jgi:general stress protein 26
MTDLAEIAPAFVEMAHRIVWCTVATVDGAGRPRTRNQHPHRQWDGESLVGWIATGEGSLKTKHLAHTPFVSLTYWDPSQDTCTAECDAEMVDDDAVRTWLWDAYKEAPAPVGYDPAIIPPWAGGPTAGGFGVMRLTPTRLHVVRAMDFANALTWRR